MFRHILISAMILLTTLAGVKLATAQTPPPPGSAAPAPLQAAQRESYVLGLGDVVEVSVIGRADYQARVQIQDDGTILLPYINSIPAANRSVLALRDQIRQALIRGQYFADPAVNVSVVSFASRYVTVLGQVNTPGIIPIDRAYRVSEIIARAGGLANSAIDAITLTRADGTQSELSLSAIATAGPASDPLVNDQDKIFVAPPKTFHIYGQVNAPGSYPISHNMTIQMALARSGGLTALGSEKQIKLTRGDQEIKKPKLSEQIRPDDVLVVGERFF